jgi:capsular polysaccharide biosynthesis protein
MLDFREPVRFEEVMFFTGLAKHGTYLSPLAVQAVVDMAATIPPGGYRKLLVRRVPGWRRGRELVNEGDIARRLAARGFHVIEPGSMPLEHQIAAFKGAEHVVGSIGACMANIAFCQPGTNVTLLSS